MVTPVQRSKLVNEYLLTLFLAYTAEIRCYLELEEFDRAVQRLQEGSEKIRSRIRRYVEILFTSNPAVYLHPKFNNQISLSRLTKIYQWIDPSLNESAVFELQRNNLFSLKMDKGSESEYKWVTSLPPAIVSKSEIQGTIWGNIEETKLEAMNRPPQVLETMESMIETIQRFDSFQFEVKAISKLAIP